MTLNHLSTIAFSSFPAMEILESVVVLVLVLIQEVDFVKKKKKKQKKDLSVV